MTNGESLSPRPDREPSPTQRAIGQQFARATEEVTTARHNFLRQQMTRRGLKFNATNSSAMEQQGVISLSATDAEEELVNQELAKMPDLRPTELPWDLTNQDSTVEFYEPNRLFRVEYYFDQSEQRDMQREIEYYLVEGIIYKRVSNLDLDETPTHKIVARRHRDYELEKAAGLQEVPLGDVEAQELINLVSHFKDKILQLYQAWGRGLPPQPES